MRQYLILILFCWLSTSAFGQGWIKNYGAAPSNVIFDSEQTTDGGYIMTGFTSLIPSSLPFGGGSTAYLSKTDVNGNVLWQRNYPFAQGRFVKPTFDGGYILGGLWGSFNTLDIFLVKTDANGDTLWTRRYGNFLSDVANDIHQTPDSGYIVISHSGSPSAGTNDIYIRKIDSNGHLIWTKIFGNNNSNKVESISPTNDGAYIIAGHTFLGGPGPTAQQSNFIKIDDNGNQIWSKNYIGSNAYAAIPTRDSGYITYCHYYDSTGNTFTQLMKLDINGDSLWTQIYGSTRYLTYHSSGVVKETTDGGYITSIDQGDSLRLLKIAANGQLEWSRGITGYSSTYRATEVIEINGGYAITTATRDNNLSTRYLIVTDSLGRVYTNHLSGNIYSDNNANCLFDSSTDNSLSGYLIELAHTITGESLFITTDSNGYFSTAIDTGTYIVHATQYSPYHYNNCLSQIDTVKFDSFHQRKTFDLALTPLVQCPLLFVDISAPFIRQTANGSYYTVTYRNRGTRDAQNAYVEINLDPNLTLLSSSIPVNNQVGNNYRFNIGHVTINDFGSFTLHIIGDTTATIGQTICTEAHIYPDSICIPNLWNGPILAASAQCLNDTVYFEVRNKGAAMTIGNTYYVYEDNIMLRTGTTNPLGTNATQQIIQSAAQGRTYRFEVEQNANFPALLGDSIAVAAIAGCNPFPGGLFNTGFLTQFSNGSSAPFEAIDCQPLRTSYDPNDKSAQPVGYGSDHYIYDYTALDYKIRFQNTGTDTAFRVVIRDTLSPYLNPASIQMGASSHNYTWRVYGANILEVTFDNILLPDSSTNELASNGFFRFRIEQTMGNPLGAVIYNSAAIYFDYNPPIITNETFHTIGENFVLMQLLGTEDLQTDEIDKIKLYPNPFEQQTILEIEGKAYQQLQLNIYDLTGKLLQQQSGSGRQIILQRKQLEAGMYIYQLEGDGTLLNTGKIIVR